MKIFTKWERTASSCPMIASNIDIFYNIRTTRRVFVDVYRKKKWNGVYKYKNKVVSYGDILSQEELSF